MKWPKELTLARHGQSAYNALRKQKDADSEYQHFKRLMEKYPDHPETREFALRIKAKYALGIGDYETPLTEEGHWQARMTGTRLRREIALPDVVIYSPYVRTEETRDGLCEGWPDLHKVKMIEDDRVREQEHGLSIIYSDWRVFHALHPEQRELQQAQGPYWYQYPQGESVAQVRDRVRSMLNTLTREYAGKRVLVVTHHLTILSARATIERLPPHEFIRLDNEEKPINLGITIYDGDETKGSDGKLILRAYNKKLY